MKTTIIRIAFATILLVTIGSFSVNAQSNDDFFFDRKYENGQLVSKTKYELGYSGLYEQTYRYEYAYNLWGQLEKEETLKWNSRKAAWDRISCITHTFDIIDNTMTLAYQTWNKKSMQYNEVSEYTTYQLDAKGNLLYYSTAKGKKESTEKMTMF